MKSGCCARSAGTSKKISSVSTCAVLVGDGIIYVEVQNDPCSCESHYAICQCCVLTDGLKLKYNNAEAYVEKQIFAYKKIPLTLASTQCLFHSIITL